MAKKKLVETIPEEKLVEVEVVTYKADEEPKEVNERPSEITSPLTASSALVVPEDPLSNILNKVQEALGTKAKVLSVQALELEISPPVKFVVIKLEKDTHKTLVDTTTLFDTGLNQTQHVGAHPEVISLISETVAKLTKDSVVVEYE